MKRTNFIKAIRSELISWVSCKVTPALSAELQKIAFKNGFRWEYLDNKVLNSLDAPYLYFHTWWSLSPSRICYSGYAIDGKLMGTSGTSAKRVLEYNHENDTFDNNKSFDYMAMKIKIENLGTKRNRLQKELDKVDLEILKMSKKALIHINAKQEK